MTTPQYILHCHHDILFEKLREPIEKRVAHIKEKKSAHEHETRLRVMRVLTDEEMHMMPLEAWKAWEKARETAWEKARETGEAWEKAWDIPGMQAWHKKVCVSDCPWDG